MPDYVVFGTRPTEPGIHEVLLHAESKEAAGILAQERLSLHVLRVLTPEEAANERELQKHEPSASLHLPSLVPYSADLAVNLLIFCIIVMLVASVIAAFNAHNATEGFVIFVVGIFATVIPISTIAIIQLLRAILVRIQA